MNKILQQYLLKLAHQTLEEYFKTGKKLVVAEANLEPELKETRGVFVTLHKQGNLRGCIGHIEPVQEVYLDVIDNVLAAAFEDNRFSPLPAEELEEIDVEISVLTQPKKLVYTSAEELLRQLEPLRDGVIIKRGYQGATYLPQVWEDLPDKQEFLSSLCMKAGLSAEAWQVGDLEVQTYQAEVFAETA